MSGGQLGWLSRGSITGLSGGLRRRSPSFRRLPAGLRGRKAEGLLGGPAPGNLGGLHTRTSNDRLPGRLAGRISIGLLARVSWSVAMKGCAAAACSGDEQDSATAALSASAAAVWLGSWSSRGLLRGISGRDLGWLCTRSASRLSDRLTGRLLHRLAERQSSRLRAGLRRWASARLS